LDKSWKNGILEGGSRRNSNIPIFRASMAVSMLKNVKALAQIKHWQNICVINAK